ncbi:cyclic nucleotide-binding domain-containing protein [Chitinophaga niabensis]|uniref:cAMP-binding domain of CRP or a regulatory subunit of cAMP-dependent protein kinases n=1 Tax=Chitinophaga niabensis TaxID=536979 RepID=A0A1N6JYD7_9BACT|nr:cyclic nucleotide-binding domain-containing protein [Chitinophaga niabensis]SIO49273.1 hypothetical protein SAMN04488055_4685 [Chitinophaga niabensis]
MENMNQEAIYSQLREALCKDKPVADADWNVFIEITRIDQFEENEVIVEPGQLSTHSYFVIKGLLMCYRPLGSKNAILWFRAENEYAFTVDKLNLGKASRVNEERLVALEDSIVVSIRHEDLAELQISNQRVLDMMHDLFMKTLFTFDNLSKRTMNDPEHDYEWVQQHVTFDLNRVPLSYLSTYLCTSAKRVVEIYIERSRKNS